MPGGILELASALGDGPPSTVTAFLRMLYCCTAYHATKARTLSRVRGVHVLVALNLDHAQTYPSSLQTRVQGRSRSLYRRGDGVFWCRVCALDPGESPAGQACRPVRLIPLHRV